MSELRIPNHVGIIMDGNGRWAKKRGLPRSIGHKHGAQNLEKLAFYMFKKGVKYVSVYAFSTENFKRDTEEVDYLMNLFVKWFGRMEKKLNKERVRAIFSGRREMLNENVLNVMEKLEQNTKDNECGVVNFCIAYGGQYEILDMVKKISNNVKDGIIDINDIDINIINQYMYHELPPIDFVIRTSGELRISNFMLWQSAYAEYYFPEVLFPDFDEKEFDKAIIDYNKRDRRFGGVKK